MQQPATGELPAIQMVPCRYFAPAFIQRFDEDYGKSLKENGGYVTYTIRMEGWKEPRWWEKALRFLNPTDRNRTDSKK